MTHACTSIYPPLIVSCLIFAWNFIFRSLISTIFEAEIVHFAGRNVAGPPRDCKVGEWGPWSACSRSCGVGETQRTRKITIKPRRGGSSCPPLKETKWCGSASPCSDGKSILDSYQW